MGVWQSMQKRAASSFIRLSRKYFICHNTAYTHARCPQNQNILQCASRPGRIQQNNEPGERFAHFACALAAHRIHFTFWCSSWPTRRVVRPRRPTPHDNGGPRIHTHTRARSSTRSACQYLPLTHILPALMTVALWRCEPTTESTGVERTPSVSRDCALRLCDACRRLIFARDQSGDRANTHSRASVRVRVRVCAYWRVLACMHTLNGSRDLLSDPV